jgi:hypothetical protein
MGLVLRLRARASPAPSEAVAFVVVVGSMDRISRGKELNRIELNRNGDFSFGTGVLELS